MMINAWKMRSIRIFNFQPTCYFYIQRTLSNWVLNSLLEVGKFSLCQNPVRGLPAPHVTSHFPLESRIPSQNRPTVQAGGLVGRGTGGWKVKDRGMWCTSQRHYISTVKEQFVHTKSTPTHTLYNIKLRRFAQCSGIWIVGWENTTICVLLAFFLH